MQSVPGYDVNVSDDQAGITSYLPVVCNPAWRSGNWGVPRGRWRSRASLAAALSLTAIAASAQMTPVGTWRSLDENGQPKAQVRIEARGDTLHGHIERILQAGADPQAVCSACAGAKKNQPIAGLEILSGVRQRGSEAVWEDGRILDPEKGSEYRLRLTPIEGGARLQVRGSLGPFSRTQTWVRVAP